MIPASNTPELSRSDIESRLQSVWADVMKRPTVPVDLTFIELDGDSLDAMLCVSRVRTLFGVELFVEDFFMDESTIRHFAELIERLSRDKVAS